MPQDHSDLGFEPSPHSDLGFTPAPSFGVSQTPAHAMGKGDLPPDLPQKAIRMGVKALPAIGAGAAAAFAPEGFLPAVLAAAAGGALGSGVKQGIQYGMGAPEAPKS